MFNNARANGYNADDWRPENPLLMAKIIFKLRSVSDDEADDVRQLLNDNHIDFYESPAGNWGISLHALWLHDDDDYQRAKKLIDTYQRERSERVRMERQQQIERGEHETFVQRLLNRPLQVFLVLAFIAFILYVSVMPFLGMGKG